MLIGLHYLGGWIRYDHQKGPDHPLTVAPLSERVLVVARAVDLLALQMVRSGLVEDSVKECRGPAVLVTWLADA